MAVTLKPFVNIGPGQIIKRNLASLNWSQNDLAEITGLSVKSISLLINNKQSITIDTAITLSKVFNSSPKFWLNLDQNYRLLLKKDGKKEKDTELKAKIRRYFPLSELKRKGWIESDKTLNSQMKAFRDFWETADIDFSFYNLASYSFFSRKSNKSDDLTDYNTITWLQKARVVARSIYTEYKYENNISELAFRIPDFSVRPNGISEFLLELEKFGVKFFILSHLSKTYLDGMSFNDGTAPVCVFTARYNRIDNFWFTMAHELAHIALHLSNIRDVFIENFDEKDSDSSVELEADLFANKVLKTNEILDKSIPYLKYFTDTRLLALASKISIHPSIILGVLHYHGKIDYRTLSSYRLQVLPLIDEKYKKG